MAWNVRRTRVGYTQRRALMRTRTLAPSLGWTTDRTTDGSYDRSVISRDVPVYMNAQTFVDIMCNARVRNEALIYTRSGIHTRMRVQRNERACYMYTPAAVWARDWPLSLLCGTVSRYRPHPGGLPQ